MSINIFDTKNSICYNNNRGWIKNARLSKMIVFITLEAGGKSMPFINTKINCSISDQQKSILKEELGKAISLIPGKSQEWLMLGFEDDYSLYFKGKDYEKLAYVDVKLFGKAEKAAYNELTAAICNIYNTILGIPKECIYITYEEISNWGWNGRNF